MAHLGEERYDTILDLLFHLTSTRVGANELWNPLFDTKAPLIAVSNFAISFVFDQPWRHHLRSNVSVTATLAEWNGQLDRGNQVGEGRGLVPATGEGARGCRACSRDGQEGVRDRKWGVAAEKNILYLASAVLYNPGIRLASRCGFIPRYTVHLPTPSRRNQLRFLFPRGVPFLPPFPSPRLHRNSAAVFSFFFLFFELLRSLRHYNRATTTSSTRRDEVIRGYVSEVSILLASHGTGKNRDRIDHNLKRSSGMHYMTGRTGSFMDI